MLLLIFSLLLIIESSVCRQCCLTSINISLLGFRKSDDPLLSLKFISLHNSRRVDESSLKFTLLFESIENMIQNISQYLIKVLNCESGRYWWFILLTNFFHLFSGKLALQYDRTFLKILASCI